MESAIQSLRAEDWLDPSQGPLRLWSFVHRRQPCFSALVLGCGRLQPWDPRTLSSATHWVALLGLPAAQRFDPDQPIFGQLRPPNRWETLREYDVPAGSNDCAYARVQSCIEAMDAGLLSPVSSFVQWNQLLFLPPGVVCETPGTCDCLAARSAGDSKTMARVVERVAQLVQQSSPNWRN